MKQENSKIEIKVWMLRNGLTGRDIAKGYKCSNATVSLFLAGKATVSGLVKYYTNLGCPAEHFDSGRVA